MAPTQTLYLISDHGGELVVFYFWGVRGTLRFREIILGTLFALAAFLSAQSGDLRGDLVFLILAPRHVGWRAEGGRSCSSRPGWSLCGKGLTGLPQQQWYQTLPENV